MKKIYLLLVSVFAFCVFANAQLTGTKNIPGDYTDLAAAITDLNLQGVGSGGVTLNLVAGNPQTAPAGGYVIGGAGSNMLITGTYPSSAANPVIVTGNGNTITASASLTAGNLNDAIIKLKGADWVTVQGFTLQENALNTVIVAATNNMTEWGIAMVYNSTTDGCQNNTIQNNTITLNRTYGNSFGIYSSSEHVDGPTNANVTTIAGVANSTTGPFDNNKVYSNIINNVNYGIVFIGASLTAANMDVGNDVGGTSAATANTLTNWGGLAKLTSYPSMTGNNAGIGFWNQVSLNISYNTVTSAAVAVTTLTHFGIIVNYSNVNPTGTFTNNVTNNIVTVTVTSTGTGGITGINTPQTTVANVAGVTLNITNNTVTAQLSGGTSTGAVGVIGCSIAAGTVNINNNTLLNCSSAANSTTLAFLEGIITYTTTSNTVGIGTLTISGNTLRGFSCATAGAVNVAMIDQNSTILTAANITNNNIGDATGGAFTGSTANTGFIFGIRNLYATNAATLNFTGNTLRGFSLVSANTAGFNGIINLLGAGPTPSVTAGTVNISNNNLGIAVAGGGLVSFSATQSIAVAGISNQTGVSGATRSLTISGNSIRGVAYNGTGNAFTGINNSFNWGTGTITMDNNFLGTGDNGSTGQLVRFNNAQSQAFLGISNTAGTGSALSISGNNFQGVNYNAASTGSFICINATSVAATETISTNNFNNLTINTSNGTIGFLISATNATPLVTISGNYITTQFTNNTSTGGANYLAIANNGSTPTTGSTTISNNVVSNVTYKTTSSFGAMIYWNSGSGAACSHNISVSGNTINNISNTGVGGGTQVTNNYGILIGLGSSNSIFNNTVSNLAAAGGTSIGIFGGTVSTNAAGSCAIYNNIIHDITTTSVYSTSAAGGAQGIQIQSGPATNNVYKNKIYNISCITGSPFTGGAAYGIYLAQATSTSVNNIFNNYIGGIYAVNSTYYQAVTGIINGSTVANTTKIYYNTTYLDGSSGGQSYCLYMLSATANTLVRNNIFINSASGNNGDEQMVIFRTGSLTGTYSSTSNNNILYCGTPGTLNLIYADGAVTSLTNTKQTLPTFQAFATPRDAVSLSVLPDFQSTTGSSTSYLHIVADDNCVLDGAGNNSGLLLADDYDGDPRSTINPFITDIGADEFTSTFILTITNPAGVCPPNTVDITAPAVTAGSTSGATVTYYNTDGVTVMTTLQASAISVSGTYYIKFVKGSCSSTQPVVVSINGTGSLAAVTGGSQVCSSNNVPSLSTTSFYDGSCNLIAKVVSSGISPVSGTVNSCVIIDPSVNIFNAEPYVQRHFDVEPSTNASTATATITLYFKNQEFIDFNTSSAGFPLLPTSPLDPNSVNLRITQYHGIPIAPHDAGNPAPGFYSGNAGNGVLITPTSVIWNSTYNYWEVTFPITGFSGFYAHTILIGGGPLPITLNYLNGVKQNGKHLLTWGVSCNSTPRATLTLERSANSRNFSSIYSITADALRCQQPFDYTDAQPLSGMNYYRLKMTDADGKVTYSNIISLLDASKGFELMSIAPNPVTGNSFKLNATAAAPTKMNVVISDMEGRVMSRQVVSLIAGYNSIGINVNNLAAGTYNIFASTPEDKSKVLRFVKQ